jgi:hypothetical protein
MRRSVLIALGAWLAVFAAGAVWAASEGTSAGAVLMFPVGARSLAMGNAYTVSSGDLGGAWHNPAVLADLAGTNVAAFYDRRIAGDDHGGVMASRPLGGGCLAGYVTYYTTGDVDLVASDGAKRTVTGQADYVAGLAYGMRVGAGLETGAAVKVLRSTLADDFSATGVSFAAGVVYDLFGDRLRCGGAIRNLGPHFTYATQDEALPWSVGFGLTYQASLGGLPLVGALDAVKTRDAGWKQHFGLECRLGGKVALRTGYRSGYDSMGFTFGLGVRAGGVEVSHGVGLVDTFDDLHLTQISYRF